MDSSLQSCWIGLPWLLQWSLWLSSLSSSFFCFLVIDWTVLVNCVVEHQVNMLLSFDCILLWSMPSIGLSITSRPGHQSVQILHHFSYLVLKAISILWLVCSMRSDEEWEVIWLKKVVFVLYWWALVVVLLFANNFSTVACSSRIVLSTVGVCIPWSCIVGQNLVSRGKGVSLFHKTISGQIVFFWFHPGWHNQ